MELSQERQLVARAGKGDADAFAGLVRAHAPYVYNLALRLLQDPQEAEDLAQETFLRAWRALPRFRAEARFATWLYRIATNLCYNRLPVLKAELKALDPDEGVPIPDEREYVSHAVLSDELQAHLHRAIAELPDGYRLLITLRHLQGMSYAEIAEATQMPLGTVKTGIFRARRQLQEVLAEWKETI
jgi:RNA polymerase sigma-70 factor (ECF subfamily)